MKGVKLSSPPPPQKKFLSKSPVLLGLTIYPKSWHVLFQYAFDWRSVLLTPAVLNCLHNINFLLLNVVDIESRSELRNNLTFKFCHWNLSVLAAHEFTKLSLYKFFINHIDIIHLLETFLDSSVSIDDNRLRIPGYPVVGIDNSSNTKRVGVCFH